MNAVGVHRWWSIVSGVLTMAAVCEASLVGDFGRFLGPSGAGTFPDPLGPVLSHLGAHSIEFPIPSTTPGFTFDYDPHRGTFERSDASPGPVFIERAETVGQGRFSVGFTYFYGNFDQFDGNDFTTLSSVSCCGNGVGATLFTSADISIPIHEFAFSGTYGITDRWDVNLFLPLLYSRLRADVVQTQQPYGGRLSPVGSKTFDEGSFGVGDILLRTKYRLGYFDGFGFGLGLVFGMPTGNADDFRGTGDWTVEPLLVVSRDIGRNNIHMTAGMDFDPLAFNRTAARYAAGVTLQPFDRVAFLVDVLGTSDLQRESFTADIGVPFNGGNTAPFMTRSTAVDDAVVGFYTLPRLDMVNLSLGMKFHLFEHAVAYLDAVIPVTNQGLRASVIPVGGIAYSF